MDCLARRSESAFPHSGGTCKHFFLWNGDLRSLGIAIDRDNFRGDSEGHDTPVKPFFPD